MYDLGFVSDILLYMIFAFVYIQIKNVDFFIFANCGTSWYSKPERKDGV